MDHGSRGKQGRALGTEDLGRQEQRRLEPSPARATAADDFRHAVRGHTIPFRPIEVPMKTLLGLALGVMVTQLSAQTAPDENAIRSIIQDEIVAWNGGDAVAYSRHFAADGTFTNIVGQFFTGYEAFLKQHEVIFEGRFKQTKLQHDIVAPRFLRAGVCVGEVLAVYAG